MNEIKEFFDKFAFSWDEGETCPVDKKRALLDRLGIKRGDKVIDIACGTGVITGILHETTGTDVLAVDLSDNMIDIAKRKYAGEKEITFRRCDFVTDDIDGTFDYAVIYNAYPHFLDVEGLRDKLYKILKENGRFAIVHSLSRKELDSHHAGEAARISRSLLPPEEEAAFFAPLFTPIIAEEDESHYLLVFRKK